ARQNQHRPVNGFHGLPLLGVERVQMRHRARSVEGCMRLASALRNYSTMPKFPSPAAALILQAELLELGGYDHGAVRIPVLVEPVIILVVIFRRVKLARLGDFRDDG